jgi:hypothetical protein
MLLEQSIKRSIGFMRHNEGFATTSTSTVSNVQFNNGMIGFVAEDWWQCCTTKGILSSSRGAYEKDCRTGEVFTPPRTKQTF